MLGNSREKSDGAALCIFITGGTLDAPAREGWIPMKVTVALRPTLTTRLVFCLKEEGADIPDFSRDAGEVTVRYEKANVVTYCGLGEKKRCTPAIIRSAAAKGVNRILDIKRTAFSLVLPAVNWCGRAGMDAAMEGAFLGAYRFTRYKSEKPVMMDRIEFVGHGVNAAGLQRVRTLGDAVWYARDLVNENASVMTPVRLAAEARALGRKCGLRVTELDEKAIARKGLHLLAAVGQGSPTPPRLMFVEYTGDPASKKWQAIAGKGITFDSGGQNLKPTGSIETMRSDMAGAAAVLATMKAVAALKPRMNIVGCIARQSCGSDPCGTQCDRQQSFFPGRRLHLLCRKNR